MKREFITVGPFVWGKGATIEEAYQKMQKANNSRKAIKSYEVYDVPEDCAFTNDGCFEWNNGDDPPKLIQRMSKGKVVDLNE